MSEWIEPRGTTKQLTVCVVLPSGVGSNFTVHVSKDGHSLLVSAMWPSPIMDLTQLDRIWLQSANEDRIESYIER